MGKGKGKAAATATRAGMGFLDKLAGPLLRKVSPKTGRTAREVLDGSLKGQREAIRKVEAGNNAKRLDDLLKKRNAQRAAEGLPPLKELPRTPEKYRLDVRSQMDVARRKGADADEIAKQTKAFEDGMKAETVDDTLRRIDNKPSRPSSKELRNDARDELAARGARDLEREGFSPDEAREMARHYADTIFPSGGEMPEQITHNPDMFYGGRPDAITHGDGRVNNALGSTGEGVRNAYRDWLQRMRDDGHGGSLVDVEVEF